MTTRERRRVLFVFQHYAGHPGLSGRTRHFNMCLSVADRYRSYIFSSGFCHNRKEYMADFGRYRPFVVEEVEGVGFVWLRTFAYRTNDWRRFVNTLDYSVKAFLAHFRIGAKPDVVMASVAHSFALLTGYLVSRLHRVPYVVDIGDLWPDALVSAGGLRRGSPRELVLRALSYSLYRRADAVICLTAEARKRLVEIGVSPSRIEVVFPCKTIPARPETDGGAERSRPFTVLYAGSFNSIYPLDLLVDAAALLRERGQDDIEFVLVGFGDQWERIAGRCAGMANIRVRGAVPQDELFRDLYPQADLFAVVEKQVLYGFPNKLLEYMLQARPVIAVSPTRYLEEVSLPGLVAVDRGGPEDIADAIGRMHALFRTEPGEYARLGRENRRAAETLFSVERCRSGLLGCLDGVLRASGAKGYEPGVSASPVVREMRAWDIEDVVSVHMEAFPHFFLTFLGPRFLRRYYAEVADSEDGVAYVCMAGGRLAGFVTGFRNPSGFYGRLLRRGWPGFGLAALPALLRRPASLRRLLGAFRKERETPLDADVAELSSLAVSPRLRGRGCGGGLVRAFCEGARRKGVSSVYLKTDAEGNDAVNRFYLSMEFALKRRIVTPEGRHINEYWREDLGRRMKKGAEVVQ